MFLSAFFMLAPMQRLHGYHAKLTEDFSMAIPHASGFALAAMIHTPVAFLSIKLNCFLIELVM